MKQALYSISARDPEKYQDLARRAQKSDDQELAEFFDRIGEEDHRLAEEARRLLAQRVAE